MKYINLIKSRTFWTIVALFVINGVGGIKEFIPDGFLPVVDAILGLLMIYFAKVAPKVYLKKPPTIV